MSCFPIGMRYHTCMVNKSFSSELEVWLKSKDSKTLADLGEVSGEKSFAITVLFLMFLPALPLPTGGITHIFEVITMLIAFEMIIGQRTIWLPNRWKQLKVGKRLRSKVLPFMVRRIRWFEHYSRPRMSKLLEKRGFVMFSGLLILGYTLVAFIAPPFSGLDTLPALGVVSIALSLILEDVAVFVVGTVIGTLGVALVIGLGAAVVEAISRLL